MILRLFIFSCLFLVKTQLYSQNFNVFEKDTNLYTYANLTLGDIQFSEVVFKNVEKDGKWKFFSTNKSQNNSFLDFLKLEGNFKNNKKHGQFKYYISGSAISNESPVLSTIISYKNGLLDGYFCMFLPDGSKLYDGTYSKGQKNGYFTSFYRSKDHNIESIKYFWKDTLLQWSKYNKDGLLKYSGYGNESNLEGEFTINYDNGVLYQKGLFEKGALIKYWIYDTEGYLMKEAEGQFFQIRSRNNMDNSFQANGFKDIKIENGIIKKYQNGVLKEEVRYKNGSPVR